MYRTELIAAGGIFLLLTLAAALAFGLVLRRKRRKLDEKLRQEYDEELPKGDKPVERPLGLNFKYGFPKEAGLDERYIPDYLIGSGGNGTIYEALDSVLSAPVAVKVYKAQKTQEHGQEHDTNRKHSSETEMKILRELHHPNIPRVYDWIYSTEKQLYYLVMDYVDGVDLRRFLENHQPFTHGQMVHCAMELLEALAYMHSVKWEVKTKKKEKDGEPAVWTVEEGTGHVHGDIKLSNLLLDTDGKIWLIDFGLSGRPGKRFYSPRTSYDTVPSDDETLSLDREISDEPPDNLPDSQTVEMTKQRDLKQFAAAMRQLSPIILDGVEDIFKKAERDGEAGYHDAAEMLEDFRHLKKNDKRSVWHRKQCALWGALTSLLVVLGTLFVLTGFHQEERYTYSVKTAQDAMLAWEDGDYSKSLKDAEKASLKGALLAPPCSAEAKRAAAYVLGVYDISDGYKPASSISFHGEGKPIRALLSPDGKKIAVLTGNTADTQQKKEIRVFETENGRELIKPLPVGDSALTGFAFADSDTLLYAGAEGLTRCDLYREQTQVIDDRNLTRLCLSADGTVCAAVNLTDPIAFLYSLSSEDLVGRPLVFSDGHMREGGFLADARRDIFALDRTGRYLGVSFEDGKVRLYHIPNPENPEYGSHCWDLYTGQSAARFEGGFFDHYFAFLAEQDDPTEGTVTCVRIYDLSELDERGTGSTPCFEDSRYEKIHLQADEEGIFRSRGNGIYHYNTQIQAWEPVLGTESRIQTFQCGAGRVAAVSGGGGYTFLDEDQHIQTLSRSASGVDFAGIAGTAAFLAARDRDVISLFQWRTPETEREMNYDAAYPHLYAYIHTDEETSMLFSVLGFRIFDQYGQLVGKECRFPDPDGIQDQYYLRGPDTEFGEDCLQVLYGSRNQITKIVYYSAHDGRVLGTETVSMPVNTSLSVVTEQYLVSAALGGSVEIRDRTGGVLLRFVRQDANFTGAEQFGAYLILHFCTMDGDRQYGLLLDENLEIVADLPFLCDVMPDGTLVFDDNYGHLKARRILSPEEVLRQLHEKGSVGK